MSGLKMNVAAMAAAAAIVTAALPASAEQVQYNSIKVDGLDIFYREAGPKSAPTVLLLHGFPTSSHMFRELIPILAGKYHVIAPDYPGFGFSSAPPPDQFEYTFAHLADVTDDFTKQLGLGSYVIYMQDYGGPVGLRLALQNPDKVRGFIVQNAVTNVEGWNPDVVASFAPAWKNRTPETEKALRAAFSADATKFQYTHSGARGQNVSPDTWTFDQALLDRPGNDKIQVELLYQYQDNVAQYPAWQAYLKKAQPPMLVVWGNNDPFFTLAGRDYFKSLVPSAEVHDYDAGHFALETHLPEISSAILSFLGRLRERS